MDRATPEIIKKPSVETAARLPLDLDEDPADESIYGNGYRTRVGVVVADSRPPAVAEAAPATSVVARS